jgi:hypothetical protein
MIGFSNLPNESQKYTLVSQSHFSQVKDIASNQRINFQQGSSPDSCKHCIYGGTLSLPTFVVGSAQDADGMGLASFFLLARA